MSVPGCIFIGGGVRTQNLSQGGVTTSKFLASAKNRNISSRFRGNTNCVRKENSCIVLYQRALKFLGQRFRVLAGLLTFRRSRRKVTGSAGQVPPSRLRKPASNGRLRQFRRSRLIAECRNRYLSLRISLRNAS